MYNHLETFRYRMFMSKTKGKKVDSYQTLNDVLVNLFRDIMDIEQKAVATQEFQDITSNDLHVIEAIGVGSPKNMSTIARELSVTVGTLTIAMNGLVKKGYVTRERGREDRRVVYISLSEKGRKAYAHHARFHQEMIGGIQSALTPEEMAALVKALEKLKSWFGSFQPNE
ncbi:MAG TPA: MarR family transcriptional regulator [Candidatus Lachnoclostridium stercorigallinarum]|uniref:MarR family transcriptional regulator n=1 Tax=Candidatus Lachnoclostridium stercorigallinarum TaxID=2838634 RepID=A0A9D2GET7_9FIRM|nr:MarR family transcriptional regulator [Candidatus Lachnoclostridium stercorigallinarum]